jgi:hypothetical protein
MCLVLAVARCHQLVVAPAVAVAALVAAVVVAAAAYAAARSFQETSAASSICGTHIALKSNTFIVVTALVYSC